MICMVALRMQVRSWVAAGPSSAAAVGLEGEAVVGVKCRGTQRVELRACLSTGLPPAYQVW